MEDIKEDSVPSGLLQKDAPELVALLKEMKEGLDTVTNKVQVLTAKVKENGFPTADGMSYLEAKHLLLLSYCQSIVYYLIRKAKGFSIEGHPVVRSLVEIRLFLEKVRPIDKKLDYQIQKLLRTSGSPAEKVVDDEKKPSASQDTEDILKYRPNPDMFVSNSNNDPQDGDGVYRPPKFRPTVMEDDKMSKEEKQASRKDKMMARKAKQSSYVKELMDNHEGKPEEVTDTVGADSRELTVYKKKLEMRRREEEELFTRAPLSRKEKMKGKHLLKSRNGLLGLTDDFEDDMRTLGFEDDDNAAGFNRGGSRGKKFNKHKRKR